MSTTKPNFPPGPWRQLKHEHAIYILPSGNSPVVCDIRLKGTGRNISESLALVNLLVVAPEMHDAIEAMLAAEMLLPDHPQRQAAYKQARDVYAKSRRGD
jgi:hypothetical protein